MKLKKSLPSEFIEEIWNLMIKNFINYEEKILMRFTKKTLNSPATVSFLIFRLGCPTPTGTIYAFFSTGTNSVIKL